MNKVAIFVSVVLSVSFLLGVLTGCQTETKTTAPPILEFGELASDDEEAKWENELGRWKPANAVIDGEEKALTSQYFEDLFIEYDKWGMVLLVFEYNEEGSRLSEQITERLIGHPLAIFRGDEPLRGEDGQPITHIVQSVITDMGQIEGLLPSEAMDIYEQWAESSTTE